MLEDAPQLDRFIEAADSVPKPVSIPSVSWENSMTPGWEFREKACGAFLRADEGHAQTDKGGVVKQLVVELSQ